ncbi:LpqB family beta-propeller domain-containing protein [Nonomuraea cavernae]|uniref:Lipoprotein LpqB n=1 Tax=Nonomuraea cavernae TaxID=2045107 RepID=A0A917Z5A0_9ACTN|nr:LpqB family beta-propeller domain-containing protein [Nonomuraea cavernae]MCA2185760.1 LpqB family beta-propeller domain-containing protein [Nonomuraea cavernae]GGO75720.1 lipoprotein LpqB [Nonomuraea cavernae]
MTRTSRLGAALVLAAAVACAGSGCAVIPVGGPFPVEEAGGGDLSKPFQRMIAVSPRDDWSPQQVVQGLQAAMAAYADDPEVLPGYLTGEAAKTWRPDGPVTVIGNTPKYEYVGKGDGKEVRIRLTGTPVARIEDDDTYVPISGAQPQRIDFLLLQNEQGAYRVTSMEGGSGLLLTQDDVSRAYRPTSLYYLAGPPGVADPATDRRLVADRVRLRVKPTENFAETIVRRLLQGPSRALSGAVGSVFPQGLSVRSVRSADDRVVVNLSGPIDAGGVFADGLKAQLKWSLNANNVANGRIIEVQLDGEPFFSSEALTIPAILREEWLDNDVRPAYYTSKGAVHSLNDDGAGNAVQGPAGQPGETYTNLAMSGGGDLIAGKHQGGGGIWVTRVAPDGRWEQWIPGNELTAPSWHRDGTLWTYDKAAGAVLRCDVTAGRGPERVAAPGLDNLDVTRLRIARDGVRVAVTIGENQVMIGAITSGAGATMLGNFQTLTTVKDEEIRDIAWRDGERLLVLVQSNAVQSVREINIGDGETTQLPTGNKGLKSLTALSDRVLAATQDGGEVLEFKRESQAWTSKVESDADSPLFPLG